MSMAYKRSESARTRPNTKKVIEKVNIEEFYDDETLKEYKKSPVLLKPAEAEGFSKNCFVEVIQSASKRPAVKSDLGGHSMQEYSIINVDPNITVCDEHPDLYLHEDKTVLKPGDKFDSHESFRLYIDRKAESWHHYYSCADSRTQLDKEYYTYRCVYGKPKNDYQAKGLRKRAETLKTNCPCKVVLKRLSYNADVLTVVFVCNHHNHELSKESFVKLQHGRRLPANVKEEIMDLLYLDVDPVVIGNYARSITGLNLKNSYILHVARTMKKNNMERRFSTEKLTMLYQKIDDIKRMFERRKYERNPDRQNVKPRKGPRKNNMDSDDTESQDSESHDVYDNGPSKRSSHVTEHYDSNKKSRLETCLQKLSYDEETLQSVKRLQNSVQCESLKNNRVKEEAGEWVHTPSRLATTNQNNAALQNEYPNDSNVTGTVENIQTDNDGHNNGDIELSEVTVENDGDLPDSYMVENCTIETYEVCGEEYTECEVIYDNDHTEVVEQEVEDETVEAIAEYIKSEQPTVEQEETQVVERNNDTSVVNTSRSPEYEYIHRYNIDQYMIQPWFPKYIEKVAEDTNISIVDLMTNIYLGKAMFKMTVTKKMEAKTIRIMYIVENVPTLEVTDNSDREYKAEATKYCKKFLTLKKKLSDSSKHIRSLTEAVAMLTKENDELKSINTYLESVQNDSQMDTTQSSYQNEVELTELRESKENLLSEISDAERKIAHLEEIKKNLKRDICKFVSKKVLLKQVSGDGSDKRLKEVKRTITNAINNCKNAALYASLENSNDNNYNNGDDEG